MSGLLKMMCMPVMGFIVTWRVSTICWSFLKGLFWLYHLFGYFVLKRVGGWLFCSNVRFSILAIETVAVFVWLTIVPLYHFKTDYLSSRHSFCFLFLHLCYRLSFFLAILLVCLWLFLPLRLQVFLKLLNTWAFWDARHLCSAALCFDMCCTSRCRLLLRGAEPDGTQRSLPGRLLLPRILRVCHPGHLSCRILLQWH